MKEFNKKTMQKTTINYEHLKAGIIYVKNFGKRSYEDDKNILCYFRKYNS